MRRAFRKPYVYWIIAIFLAYFLLNSFLSDFYSTLLVVPYYLDTLAWGKFILGIIFSLIIAALVALSSVCIYIKHKTRKDVRKEEAVTCVAAIGGLATGICPACISGLMPIILDIFSVSFSWATLPFYGLEVQLALILLLLLNLSWACKTK